MFTDFRIFSNFLICFRKFDWKSDTRHSFLEFVAKSGQNFIKKSQKKCKSRWRKWKKAEIQYSIAKKMLVIVGWNFEIEERCKVVHCVDLGESFPTSIYLQKSASIQPRTSPSKFGAKFNSISIRRLSLCPFRGRIAEQKRRQLRMVIEKLLQAVVSAELTKLR